MLELGRRTWCVGLGALLVSCERTKAPSGGGGETSVSAKSGAPVRVGELDPALGVPLQLVPSRSGESAMVVLRGGFAIADTMLHAHPFGSHVDRRAVATNTGWCIGSLHVDARGQPGASLRGLGSLDESGARQLALRVAGDDWISAVALEGNRPMGVLVTRRSPGDGPRWNFEQPGRAAAAIDDAGAIVLVTDDGHLRVLGDPNSGQDTPRVRVDVAIDRPAYAVTFDQHGIVVLAAVRDDTHRDAGDRVAAPVDWQPTLVWSTDVMEHGRDGSPGARTSVAFAALQAPLRLSDGTLAIVGMGAARIADGKTTWTRTASSRLHGCAAGDELLLGDGPTIQRIGPDGIVRSRDPVGDAPVACPPAVGPDGRVWIATTHAVWRIG